MNMYPDPPDGMCIDATTMMKKIEQRGWKLKYEGRYRDIPEFINMYWKGEHGYLRLHFTKKTNCVVSLEMSFHTIRFF